MGILQLLGGKNKDKIIDTALGAVKGIGKFIDEQKLTTEEAMRANISIADSVAQFAKDTLSESTERSVTRRKIAVFIIYFFCSLVVGLIILKIAEQYIESIDGAADYAKGLVIEFNLHWAFIAVIGFFFGTHTLRSYQGQVKAKK